MNHFFVCGAPKSGTTWLQRMLNAHPQIACGGEGHFVEFVAGPVMTLAKVYAKKMKSVNDFVYGGEGTYDGFQRSDVINTSRFAIERLMQRQAEPQTMWLGDKTPRYFEYLDDLSVLFPECVIIQLVRDPRDVAVSLIYHGIRRGMADANVRGSKERARLVDVAVSRWIMAQERCDAFAAKDPDRYIELRYEDLLADAQSGLQRVCTRFAVDPTPAALDQIVEATSFKKTTGREAGSSDPAAFLRKGVAGDWRGELFEEDVARIADKAADWMAKKGYS